MSQERNSPHSDVFDAGLRILCDHGEPYQISFMDFALSFIQIAGNEIQSKGMSVDDIVRIRRIKTDNLAIIGVYSHGTADMSVQIISGTGREIDIILGLKTETMDELDKIPDDELDDFEYIERMYEISEHANSNLFLKLSMERAELWEDRYIGRGLSEKVMVRELSTLELTTLEKYLVEFARQSNFKNN